MSKLGIYRSRRSVRLAVSLMKTGEIAMSFLDTFIDIMKYSIPDTHYNNGYEDGLAGRSRNMIQYMFVDKNSYKFMIDAYNNGYSDGLKIRLANRK